MAKRVTVLGGGRVGHAMALDLAHEGEFEVRVADASAAALESLAGAAHVETMPADLADAAEIRRAVAGADFAIGAVPGFMGFRTLETVIDAGIDVVDITFFAEDSLRLDATAKAKGVTAVVDAGVAPGLTNVLAGHHAATWDRLDRFVCGVGGLPVVRTQPSWEYKAAFSPVDVLEIYTRPARVVEGGRVIAKPALAEIGSYEFPGVGTVDAFATDGLRTLLSTIACPEMRELTLRYPGHAAKMRMLRDAGFLSDEPVEIGDARIAPIELTGRLLFPLWQYGPGEEDLTIFFCEADGAKDGAPISARWIMLDRYDRASRVSSMARTTGYTATAALRLLASGTFRPTGVVPPEWIGRDAAACAFLLDQLARRGVRLERVG